MTPRPPKQDPNAPEPLPEGERTPESLALDEAGAPTTAPENTGNQQGETRTWLPSLEELMHGKGLSVEASKRLAAEIAARFPADVFPGGPPEVAIQQWVDATFGDAKIHAVLMEAGRAAVSFYQTGKGVVGHSAAELI